MKYKFQAWEVEEGDEEEFEKELKKISDNLLDNILKTLDDSFREHDIKMWLRQKQVYFGWNHNFDIKKPEIKRKRNPRTILDLVNANCPIKHNIPERFLVRCPECLKCIMRISFININGEPFHECGLLELYWSV